MVKVRVRVSGCVYVVWCEKMRPSLGLELGFCLGVGLACDVCYVRLRVSIEVVLSFLHFHILYLFTCI